MQKEPSCILGLSVLVALGHSAVQQALLEVRTAHDLLTLWTIYNPSPSNDPRLVHNEYACRGIQLYKRIVLFSIKLKVFFFSPQFHKMVFH